MLCSHGYCGEVYTVEFVDFFKGALLSTSMMITVYSLFGLFGSNFIINTS